MGIPLPGLMGFVVAFVELVGGILLIFGFLPRLATLLLKINLTVVILLVKVNVGLIASMHSLGVDAELDLALIAVFLVILLAGPGKPSLDYALGLERDAVEERTA